LSVSVTMPRASSWRSSRGSSVVSMAFSRQVASMVPMPIRSRWRI
jgi:hypothetical protein